MNKKDSEMIKKSLQDGGVWKYSVGDEVIVDSDFGYVKASIDKLLPEGNYVVSNGTTIKEPIQISEEDIFDPKVKI